MSLSVFLGARSAPAVLWAGAAASLGLVAVVLGLLSTGAAAPLLLGDPGPVVRWGLPVVTVMSRLAAGLTVGALVVCAAILPSGQSWRACRDLSVAGAAAWAACQVLEALFDQLLIVGEPVESMTAARFIEVVAVSRAPLLAALFAAVVAVAVLFVSTATGAGLVVVLAAVALIPIAETGHAAGTAGHGAAVSGMWLHLVFIGIWIGGLAALLFVTRLGELRRAAPRYSVVAGWSFAIVAFSGIVNTLLRVESPVELVGTQWGMLLLIKVVFVVLLGGAGYLHRSRTLRDLERGAGRDHGESAFRRLAGNELILMGAVAGISVALGASAPPTSPVAGRFDPALALTGEPMPAAPSLLGYVTQWRMEPLLLLAPVVGCLVYLRWVGRLRRRGDAWPLGRSVSWVSGMILFAWVVAGGPAVHGAVQFSVHMAQHLALITALPILYVLGMPVTLALRTLPKRDDSSMGPREWLLWLLGSAWARFLSHPVVASLHVVVSMAVLYLTPLFELTLVNHWAHLLMVVHISLVGYLFVNVLIGRDPGPRRPPYAVRLALLLPSMLFHTFFGLAVLWSTSLMAASYYGRLAVPWVDDVLLDQQIGGALTWAMGEIPALALGLVIAARWTMDDVRAQERAARRRELPEATRLPG